MLKSLLVRRLRDTGNGELVRCLHRVELLKPLGRLALFSICPSTVQTVCNVRTGRHADTGRYCAAVVFGQREPSIVGYK